MSYTVKAYKSACCKKNQYFDDKEHHHAAYGLNDWERAGGRRCRIRHTGEDFTVSPENILGAC